MAVNSSSNVRNAMWLLCLSPEVTRHMKVRPWAQLCLLLLVSGCRSTQPAQSATPATSVPAPDPSMLPGAPTGTLQLIATYVGTLPCADCAGIRTELSLYAEGPSQFGQAIYRLNETYLETGDGDRTFESTGRWTILRGTATDLDATVYQLDFDRPQTVRNLLRPNDNELRLLDREQREVQSQANHTLLRTQVRRVGGYDAVNVSDPTVREAANFAVEEQAKKVNQRFRLMSVASAEQQVVAGMNYRLCLDVGTDSGSQKALAIVYRNVQGQYSLTTWEVQPC